MSKTIVPRPMLFACASIWLAACAADPGTDNWKKVTPGDAPAGSPVALHGQLRVEMGPATDAAGAPTTIAQIVDKNGAPLQLRGASSMWLNWESQPFAESKDGMKFMRDKWKATVFRAAMGVEADGGYITNPQGMGGKVETIIHNAIDMGMYVIVDWHSHAAHTQPDKAIAFFTEMATKYGAYPNVIWETYNEPKGVTWEQIKPYHEAVVAAIRAVDPDNLIVLGTPNWSQRVDLPAANPVAGTNLLYTLHFYSCEHAKWLRDFGDTALSAGLALFVTEFGATFANGGTPGKDYVCPEETNLYFEWMARNNISGAAWKLDICADTSCILNPNANYGGNWPDSTLTTYEGGTPYTAALPKDIVGTAIKGGHGKLVVNWMRQ